MALKTEAKPRSFSVLHISSNLNCKRISIRRITDSERLLAVPYGSHSAEGFFHGGRTGASSGLLYYPDVITPEDESRLPNQIADVPVKEFQFHGFEGKRRVVSFGWRYDFSEHKALPADPIPDFCWKGTAGFRQRPVLPCGIWRRS